MANQPNQNPNQPKQNPSRGPANPQQQPWKDDTSKPSNPSRNEPVKK